MKFLGQGVRKLEQERYRQTAYAYINVRFFRRPILTRKVGQVDIVFGVRSGFICKCVHARLQVSVCSGYDLWHHD